MLKKSKSSTRLILNFLTVLILILMEHAQRAARDRMVATTTIVLILILMEHAQRESYR